MDYDRFDQLDDLCITREDEVRDYDYLDDLDGDALFEKATGKSYTPNNFLKWFIDLYGEEEVEELIWNNDYWNDKIVGELKGEIKNSD